MEQGKIFYCPRCGAKVEQKRTFCTQCHLSFVRRPGAHNISASDDTPAEPGLSANPAPVLSTTAIATLSPVTLTAASRHRPVGKWGTLLLVSAALLVVIAGLLLLVQSLGIGRPTQAPIRTTPVAAMVIYGGLDITITNAQQAQSFLDDPQTQAKGMLRVQLHVRNTTGGTLPVSYTSLVHLMPSGGGLLNPLYISNNPTLAPGMTADSSIDFAFPASTPLTQTTLRLGRPDEVHYDIPLRAHADTNKYAPRRFILDKQLAYFGMNWTLIQAQTRYSLAAQQAPEGMHFVILTLRVDNTLSQQAIVGSPFDYLRLQTDTLSYTPVQSDLPVSLTARTQMNMGTATFLVPSNITAFSCVLQAQATEGIDQARADFQLQ